MDSRKPSGNETRVRRAALVTVIALTMAWSSSALSRTQPVAACDVDHDLQNLSTPVDSLVLKPVDHVPTEPDVSDLESIDIEWVSGVTDAPLLKFAPYGNDTLRGVYDEDGRSRVGEASREISVAPIAESEEIPELSELPDDSATDGTTIDESDLPLLERQMYRIDI